MSYPNDNFPTPYDLYDGGDNNLREIFECQNCSTRILEGDYYYDINGECWCELCISRAWRLAE